MGNVAVAEELAGSDELDELYRLDASESEPEDEPEDDDDEDEDEDEGRSEPEGCRTATGRRARRIRLARQYKDPRNQPQAPGVSAI